MNGSVRLDRWLENLSHSLMLEIRLCRAGSSRRGWRKSQSASAVLEAVSAVARVRPDGRGRIGLVQGDRVVNDRGVHQVKVHPAAHSSDEVRAASRPVLRGQCPDAAENAVHEERSARHGSVCEHSSMRRVSWDAEAAPISSGRSPVYTRRNGGELCGGADGSIGPCSVQLHATADPGGVDIPADRIDDPGPIAVGNDARVRHGGSLPAAPLVRIARVAPECVTRTRTSAEPGSGTGSLPACGASTAGACRSYQTARSTPPIEQPPRPPAPTTSSPIE